MNAPFRPHPDTPAGILAATGMAPTQRVLDKLWIVTIDDLDADYGDDWFNIHNAKLCFEYEIGKFGDVHYAQLFCLCIGPIALTEDQVVALIGRDRLRGLEAQALDDIQAAVRAGEL